MTPPILIDTDGAAIVARMKADYETLLGKTIQPGQAEMLLINGAAFEIVLLRQQVQAVGLQSLVPYGSGIGLDDLGQLVGVFRLVAAPAQCTVRFVLVADHTGVTILEGTRVATSDGKAVFSTRASENIAAGATTVDVECYAQDVGSVGNGFPAGTVKTILDPQPFLVSAANLATTAGGSDEESDDALRQRIVLAPSSFSVAGPIDAYRFFAKSASSLIIDVAITNPTPGTVEVFPLVASGATPTEVLDLVTAALNDEKVRPLCDTVLVTAPTLVDYALEIELTVYENADQAQVITAVTDAATAYTVAKRNTLGGDIVLDQITALAMVAGVYSVNIIDPNATLVIDPTETANCTAVSVSVTGTTTG